MQPVVLIYQNKFQTCYSGTNVLYNNKSLGQIVEIL